MKDVIVSFATKGRENYNGMLLRLIDSCLEHWKGDLLIYSPDHDLSEYRGVTIHKGWPDPIGIRSYTHAEMPYQFKTALIQKAVELGYERIIWLDSSMQLKKDLTPLLDNSKTGLITFHNLGHPVKNYISDEALFYLKVNDTYIDRIDQIWGGAFLMDFTKPFVKKFFHVLKEFSVNGSFKNSGSQRHGFIAHRHDQAVMSVLLTYKFRDHIKDGVFEMHDYDYADMLPYGQILCPPHDRTGEYGTDPYLVCRGL